MAEKLKYVLMAVGGGGLGGLLVGLRGVVAVLAAVSAAAVWGEPSWALVNTEGAGDGLWADTSGDTSRYTAYFCTVAAAETYFGGNSASDTITAYLAGSAKNYTSGMSALQSGGTALPAYGYDYDPVEGRGEYSFLKYVQPGTLLGDYIAVLAYKGVEGEADMFRVFQSEAEDGQRLLFSPTEGAGSAGAWTMSAVPEPTSALLLLLGLAGLALRRRRR